MIPIGGASVVAGLYYLFSELTRIHEAEREALGYTVSRPTQTRQQSAFLAFLIFIFVGSLLSL